MFVPSINPGHALNALSAEKEVIERKIEKRSAIIAFIDDEMRNKVSLVSEIATEIGRASCRERVSSPV